MARVGIEFDGFDKMVQEFDRMEKDLKPAVERTLEETFNVIQPGVRSAVAPHRLTGDTEDSLYTAPVVKWTGNVAEVNVGFDLRKSVTSQFLIYGAKSSLKGTPYRPPDMRLWNAVFGSAVKSKIAEVQEKVMSEELLK